MKMLKAPRFMKEYASYRKKEYEVFGGVTYADFVEKIDRVVTQYERGFITIDEAMKLIQETKF